MEKAVVGSQIESEIRLRISSGFYAEGSTLPSQQELAKEFQTSQTTISKALDRIRQSGIIERKPRLGTRVIPFDERSSNGAVCIFYSGIDPLLKEPNSIISGICEFLDNSNQHYECIHVNLIHGQDINTTADNIAKKYSGCIFVDAPGDLNLIVKLEEKQYPHVVANLEQELDVSCTWTDHTQSTAMAVHVLAAMGHRNIVLLSGGLNKAFYSRALEGYQKALKELNIEYKQSNVITVDHYAIDGTEAYKAMRNYLENNPLPTAIVACRDYLAWGAYQLLKEKDIEIGHDVSIIGYDDLTWPGEKSFLTTFAEPAWDLGYVAAEMLMERLIFGWKPVEKREVAASLILRMSVGPCRDKSFMTTSL